MDSQDLRSCLGGVADPRRAEWDADLAALNSGYPLSKLAVELASRL
jgi:hypothetical protein